MSTLEVEETIRRIKSHKGVKAVLIVDTNGTIISSHLDEHFHFDTNMICQLATKAKSTIRTLDPTDDMSFLRLRSKKYEIMVAPDKEYTLIVVQNPNLDSTDQSSGGINNTMETTTLPSSFPNP